MILLINSAHAAEARIDWIRKSVIGSTERVRQRGVLVPFIYVLFREIHYDYDDLLTL